MTQLFFHNVRAAFGLRVVCAGLVAGLLAASAPAQEGDYSTDEMLEDDHFREEFGINDFTTPSIKLIFDDLGNLGPIPYGDLKREAREKVSRDRVAVALNLGTLIADGFLIVQAERLKDIEPVGKSILKHAEALGTGRHIKRHSRSLLEFSALGQSDKLRSELESTQRDVEKEMVDLRDVDIAHLISLGGWARAFEIGCAVISKDFSPEKVRMIARADITSYFQAQLETLHPSIQERELVKQVNEALVQLHAMIDMPEEREFTKADLAAMSAKAKEVNELISNAR